LTFSSLWFCSLPRFHLAIFFSTPVLFYGVFSMTLVWSRNVWGTLWLFDNHLGTMVIGGVFKLELFLPEEYPMAAPKVCWNSVLTLMLWVTFAWLLPWFFHYAGGSSICRRGVAFHYAWALCVRVQNCVLCFTTANQLIFWGN
jgi:hypothetical protein